jgi:hypothetical protein
MFLSLALLLLPADLDGQTRENCPPDAFDQLLTLRLEENITYRQALIDRKRAELGLRQLSAYAIPYLELASARDGFSIADGEVQPLVIQPGIVWTNVFGTEISIRTPLTFNGENGSEAVSLNASRPLFPEEDVRTLKARAAVLRGRESEREARLAVEKKLLEDILKGYLSQRKLELDQESLRVLEKEMDAAVESKSIRSLNQRILRARRGLLQARQVLEEIDPRVNERVEELYPQAIERAERRVKELPAAGEPPGRTASIQAQELTLAAASLEGRRSFLAWLPNPLLGLSVDYNLQDQSISWKLSLQFSITLLDRGEMAMEAFRRREQPEIERMRLLQAHTNLADEIRRASVRQELLEYDIRLQEFSVEDTLEEEEHARRMYQEGFATGESWIMARIDRLTAELDMVQLKHDKLLQQLELLRLYEKTGINDEQ